MYLGGTNTRLVYNWYRNIFQAFAVLIEFHAANKKLEGNQTKIRQQIKKGRSKLCCRCQSTWLIIAPLLHHYRTAIIPLLLRCCHSVVALLSHCYRTCIAPLSLCCCRSYCCYAVTPISHRYRSTVAPLLSLLLLLRSLTAIAPLLRRCQTTIAPAQRGYK